MTKKEIILGLFREYGYAMSYAEIAERAGSTYNNVSHQIRLARKKGELPPLDWANMDDVIRLYKQELSHQEIAEKLGLTATTVGVYVSRLLKEGKIQSRGTHRGRREEHHGGAKLTREQVLEIHAKVDGGDSTSKDIAREYGITSATVRDIARGKTWPRVWAEYYEKEAKK